MPTVAKIRMALYWVEQAQSSINRAVALVSPRSDARARLVRLNGRIHDTWSWLARVVARGEATTKGGS